MKKPVAFLAIALLFSASLALRAYADEPEEIMGESRLTAEAMYLYLITNNKPNGINPINSEYARAFVLTTIEEARAEGVRADVAFGLMMHETGFLNFGGDVSPSQNNFGGLGATGSGAGGATFADMRTGIRAVIQHLKCYASNLPLANPVVDPRWNEELRAKAPYVEYLGYSDNPNSVGWAVPGEGYGGKILAMIDTMAGLDVSSVSAITWPDPSGTTPAATTSTRSFPLNLLEFNLSNLVNLSVAAVILASVVGVSRFRSKGNSNGNNNFRR